MDEAAKPERMSHRLWMKAFLDAWGMDFNTGMDGLAGMFAKLALRNQVAKDDLTAFREACLADGSWGRWVNPENFAVRFFAWVAVQGYRDLNHKPTDRIDVTGVM